ncbi:MAG: recombinase family protein [Candidatus Aminicenantales bacterium]
MKKPTDDRAVLFARVSTAKQAEKWSLPKQVEIGRNYARRNHLRLLGDPISITESGYKERERKAFRAMVDFIRENRIGHLIVLNVERLTRDLRGMCDLDDLSRDFLTIHFTESGEMIGPDTAGDKRTFWAIKVAFARAYIDDLKEKARRSIEARLSEGLYPSGMAPIEYRAVKNGLEIEKEESRFARMAFELYASGGQSLLSLSRKLYDAGLRKRPRRKKDPETGKVELVPRSGPVSPTTLQAMLKNPVYLGKVVWPFTDSRYVTDREKGTQLEGKHPALIDRSLFDQVQAALREKGHFQPLARKQFVYRGLMRCGACGRTMSGYEKKGTTYYSSNNPRDRRCGHRTCYREEAITAKFEEALARFRFPRGLYGWIRDVLKASATDSAETVRGERKRLTAEYNRNAENLSKLVTDAFDDIFPRDVLRAKYEEIEARQSQITSDLKRIGRDAARTIDRGLIILDLCQDLRGTFRKAAPEKRAKLLRVLFKEVVVRDGRFNFRVNEPFAALYSERPRNAGIDSVRMAPRAGLEPAT